MVSALESIVDQTYQNAEIVIVDNASTNKMKIIEEHMMLKLDRAVYGEEQI